MPRNQKRERKGSASFDTSRLKNLRQTRKDEKTALKLTQKLQPMIDKSTAEGELLYKMYVKPRMDETSGDNQVAAVMILALLMEARKLLWSVHNAPNSKVLDLPTLEEEFLFLSRVADKICTSIEAGIPKEKPDG